MKRLLLVILLASFVYFGFNDKPEVKYAGVERIKFENLIKTVEYLASPELNGRLGGSEGYYKAASFMADEFKKLGLKPIGDEGYFQNFNVEYNEIIAPCKFAMVNKEGSLINYKLGDDFVCRGFTGSGNINAEVVFVGYGFSEKTYDFDEYENTDVKGKIAIMFKQTPSWQHGENNWNQSLRYRAKIAQDNGALGVIFVSKPNDKYPQKPIGSVMDGEGEHLENFPMIHADITVIDQLLAANGKNLKDIQTQIDESKKPVSFITTQKVYLEVNAKYDKARKTMNVAGLLEGSDDKLKNEYLVIGAHLDHAGGQASEIYFPGANDNASGSASVLEIARAFVGSGVKPKRSILFILFSNEESGLNGANYYANNPLVPLEKTVAMFNNDCIGHGDSIQIGNGKSSPILWQITNSIDSVNTNTMISRTWNGGGADAEPFHKKGIPCLYFVSYFSYTHLHLQSDKPETLNPAVFENISRLGYMTAYEVALGNYGKETVIN
ncbi:MAG: M20/M25/M40 family metallo-hydrolase [Candidatus Kapaibacterium sp.]